MNSHTSANDQSSQKRKKNQVGTINFYWFLRGFLRPESTDCSEWNFTSDLKNRNWQRNAKATDHHAIKHVINWPHSRANTHTPTLSSEKTQHFKDIRTAEYWLLLTEANHFHEVLAATAVVVTRYFPISQQKQFADHHHHHQQLVGLLFAASC